MSDHLFGVLVILGAIGAFFPRLAWALAFFTFLAMVGGR